MITAKILTELNFSDLTHLSGSLDSIAAKVLPPENCDQDSLVFVTKPDQLAKAMAANAAIIIGHKSLTPPQGRTYFSTGSIKAAMAATLPLFDGKINRFNQPDKIHSTAVIHSSAKLEHGVTVGPYAVIGENVHIGQNSIIGTQVVIEYAAVIGESTILHPQVFIGAHCIIGSHCEIHPHTTIGSDGFAFSMNNEGKHIKIPQIGNVIIGDRVEIGANCSIDRAALTSTKIGNGTKMDNFCHVAHNVEIGEDCLMAAGFKVAGSTTIGKNCMFGGDAVITDHIAITNRVVIAGRSVVMNNIHESGQYGGYPLEPLRDALKTLANKTHLTRIRRNLNKVLKHLNLDDE